MGLLSPGSFSLHKLKRNKLLLFTNDLVWHQQMEYDSDLPWLEMSTRRQLPDHGRKGLKLCQEAWNQTTLGFLPSAPSSNPPQRARGCSVCSLLLSHFQVVLFKGLIKKITHDLSRLIFTLNTVSLLNLTTSLQEKHFIVSPRYLYDVGNSVLKHIFPPIHTPSISPVVTLDNSTSPLHDSIPAFLSPFHPPLEITPNLNEV